MTPVSEGSEAGPFEALGHRFAVRSPDPALGEWLGDILADLRGPPGPAPCYTITDRGAGVRLRWALHWGDEQVARSRSGARTVSMLLWDVNQRAAASAPDDVLVHAASVERDGVVVLFPAAMESGKSTLAGALVRAGFAYLSDEIAAYDPRTGTVRPFHRPITLDPGSWRVLPELRPLVPPLAHRYQPRQWHVRASTIRPDALSGGGVARLVVAPRYDPATATRVEPMSRAEMLVHMARQTFHFSETPVRTIEALAELLRPAACVRLSVDGLDEAVEAVGELVDTVTRERVLP